MTDRAAMLEELIELIGGPLPRGDHEITVTEFAEQAGIGMNAARARLRGGVDSGKLGTRQAIANGRRCQVYWKLGG